MSKINFLKNTFLHFSIKTIIILSWFIITIFSARFLPIADFGKFIIYNTTINLLTTFSTTFVSNSILRLYPQYKKTLMLDEFLSNMFYYILLSTATIIILILYCNYQFPLFIKKILPFKIIFLITPLIIINIYNYFLSIYRATGKVLLYSFFNFWQLIGSFCIGFLFYRFNRNDPNEFYIGYIASLILFSPIIYLKFKEVILILFDYNLTITFAKELFDYGVPILIIGTSSLLLSNLDRYFIIYLLDLNKSTLYSASYTISEQSILVITGLISITSVPYLFNIYETKGIDFAKKFQEKILKFYLFLTIPIIIILTFYYNEILFYLLGNKYQSGFYILPYISLGAFFIGLSNVFSDVFTLMKKTKILMLAYFASLIVNVILNFVLINKFDILGAAIATLCSYALLFIITYKFSRKLIKLNILKKEFLKLFLSSLILASFIFALNNIVTISNIYNIIFNVLISFFVYLSSIIVFKYYDFKILYLTFSKIRKKIIIK
jgi:O-antigen/teichoic acid export membrane protein